MEKLSTSLKVFIPIGLFLLFFSVLPASAEAATLSFSPTSGSFETGSTFSVSVRVSSANQALNAISGTVSFPTDKLQVISLSKSDSIIQLWVIEPSFSNMDGTVQFEGVALNPGFTGENGGVIRVTFRAKTVGSAPVSFLTGSILANDGSGTNILSSLGTANFNIVKATAPATPIVSATEKPEISSPTHPNKDTWYANSNPEFKWALPADVIEVRLSYSSDPDGKPDTVYKAIQSKNLSNIPSGIWYFHVQFKNAGGWGDVAHYHFQIDAEKPEHFNIITLASSDSSKIKFMLEALDKTSGIDHYEIKIDDNSPINWPNMPNTPIATYETSSINPGKHLLSVGAVDKAGNSLSHTFEFSAPNVSSPIVQRGFFGLSQEMLNLFALLALFVIILEALVFLFRYVWHKFSRHLKGVRNSKQTKGGKAVSDHEEDHSLNLFRNEMESQIMFLEETSRKRHLTKEEEKILNRLRRVTGVN